MTAILDQRVNELLQRKAAIDMELALLAPPPTTYSPNGQHPYSRNEFPRSHSHSGSSTKQMYSPGSGQHGAVAMSASVSHRSAPTMARTTSRGHSLSTSSIPFTTAGRVPPSQPMDSRQDSSMIDLWNICQDDPYPIHQQALVRSMSQRKPELGLLAEHEIDSGECPEEYFARTSGMPTVSITASPIDISPVAPWRNTGHSHRGSMPSRRRQSFGISTPTTPSTAALTRGTTLSSDMSRRSSYGNDAIIGPFEMMNVHSNNSFYTENSPDERSYASGVSSATLPSYPKLSSEEQNLLVAGACGGPSLEHFALHLPSLSQGDGAPAAQLPSSASLERQQSNESNSSSSSVKSRAVAILKRQNQLALSRPIAMKTSGEGITMSQEGSHAMISIKSKDGSEDRVVTAIPKTPYQRPKHDRVFCDQCTDYPDGFRGAHELGRHQDRQHKDQVKKWVCTEPADGVTDSRYLPFNSLSKCKACSQVKKYGAYYNAAAHLRRAHFKPKARSRGRCTKVEEKSEKRGGKGGGDWPPMSELKRWMKEVHESVVPGEQQDAEDDDDDDCSGSIDVDDEDVKHSFGTSDVDNALHYSDDFAILDTYMSPVSSFNSHNLQYETLPRQQNIGILMSSQSSYIDSHLTSMNDMAYIDSFPQNFDQSIGHNFYNF